VVVDPSIPKGVKDGGVKYSLPVLTNYLSLLTTCPVLSCPVSSRRPKRIEIPQSTGQVSWSHFIQGVSAHRPCRGRTGMATETIDWRWMTQMMRVRDPDADGL